MNFFQKGLGVIESGLDKVLLDEPEAAALAEQRKEEELRKAAKAASPDLPRSSGESARENGRSTMQERLAAAVAKKSAGGNAGRRSDSLARSGSVRSVQERTSIESQRRDSVDTNGATVKENGAGGHEEARESTNVALDEPAVNEVETQIADIENETVSEAIELPQSPPPPPPPPPPPLDAEELAAEVERLRADLMLCETRRQDENHSSAERIDTLEEKIRYLAREAADSSRSRAVSAGDPLEKKLAERDEKIALLLEEGETLSKNELKLQNTIKKLRAKAQDEEKAAAEARRKLERVERDAVDTKEKLRKAQEAERRERDRNKSLGKTATEVESLRRERDSAKAIVSDLTSKLDEANRKAQDIESKGQAEALEKEKKATVELKAQVEKVQSEAVIAEERLRNEVGDVKAKMERDAERARSREAELLGEQQIMESKMEALRARAEEVSSGAAGDAHAKLLRQVETLQSQYSIASENWQGIEATLLSRITNLERERDELAKKEADIRRKAREMNLKSKTLDLDLESAQSKIKELENDLLEHGSQLESLRQRLATAEAATKEASETLQKERKSWEEELQSKLDEERVKWEEVIQRTPRLESSPSRPSTPQLLPGPSPLSIAPGLRKVSTPYSTTESYFLGYQRPPPPRSTSADPSDLRKTSGFRTPPVRSDSFPFPRPPSSSVAGDVDEPYFEGISPSSPHRHPDIVSVSTAAAGPSVQLVERMSAAVRRLESEMAGSRDEIARMTAQRDEAREELVELMREVEEKRGAEEKTKKMEEELEQARVKLETTLEMLGEKSERVDELQADVDDLKQMYRDLVSATVK